MATLDEEVTSLMGGKRKTRHSKNNDGKPRKKSAFELGRADNVSPKVNSKVIAYTLDLMNMEPCDIKDPADVDRAFFDYLGICDRNMIRPNMAGLATVYGMDRGNFSHLIHGGHRFNGAKISTPEAVAEMRKVYTYLNAILEAEMLSDKGNPVKYIFLAKNNFGYIDQKEQVVEKRDLTDGMKDPKQIAAKYADMVDVTPSELPAGSPDFRAGTSAGRAEKPVEQARKHSKKDS